ncbi:MAG TPA: ABC transporter substrate-binding protein [Ruminococcaceae bacterium]|nr:ABC transporter substrate-binding protein [Oscillospiraceae bacterium]
MKKTLSLIFSVLLLISFAACSSIPSGQLSTGNQQTVGSSSAIKVNPSRCLAVSFTDALGHDFTIQQPQNVAALMGSFAELWLLAGGELAAVTQDAYDERGLALDSKTVNLGAMKSPSVEKLIEAKVDFAILSSNIAEHVKLYDSLTNAGIKAAYFDVETFEDYLSVLKIFTDITGKQELYKTNGTDIKAKIDAAIAKKNGKTPPTVLFIRAYSTGAKAKGSDSMTGKMLKDLGCINIADKQTSLLENLSIEQIIKEDPDYIFVTTMGESDEKALESMKKVVEANPAWKELSAVKNGRYIVLPKNLYHLKPNAKWGESYEKLAEIIYG